MYSNQFQYGKHVSLLNISEKESIDKWHTQGLLRRAYDKSVKGYVFVTDAGSRLKQPSDSKKQDLGLVQPYLLLQCKVLDKQSFHFEVAFSDAEKQRRRLIFYSSQFYTYSKDNIHRMPLHARIPCGMIMEGMWMNLQFDLLSFVEKCFDKIHFKQIDSIEIGGAVLLRRICTTKHQLPDSLPYVIERDYGEDIALEFEQYVASSDHQNIENLDKQLNFQVGVDHMNQVVSFERIIYFGYIQEGDKGAKEKTPPKKRFMNPKIDFALKGRRKSRLTALPQANTGEKEDLHMPREEVEQSTYEQPSNGISITDQDQRYDQVAQTIKKLKQKYTPSRIITQGRQEALENSRSDTMLMNIRMKKINRTALKEEYTSKSKQEPKGTLASYGSNLRGSYHLDDLNNSARKGEHVEEMGAGLQYQNKSEMVTRHYTEQSNLQVRPRKAFDTPKKSITSNKSRLRSLSTASPVKSPTQVQSPTQSTTL